MVISAGAADMSGASVFPHIRATASSTTSIGTTTRPWGAVNGTGIVGGYDIKRQKNLVDFQI